MQVIRYQYTCTECGFSERLNHEVSGWECRRCNSPPGIRFWSFCSKHGTHTGGNATCKDCEELELLRKLYSKTDPHGMFAGQISTQAHEEAEINNIWAKKIEKAKKRKNELEDAQIETPKILNKILSEVTKDV